MYLFFYCAITILPFRPKSKSESQNFEVSWRKKFQLSWKVSWKSFKWVEFQNVKSLPGLVAIDCGKVWRQLWSFRHNTCAMNRQRGGQTDRIFIPGRYPTPASTYTLQKNETTPTLSFVRQWTVNLGLQLVNHQTERTSSGSRHLAPAITYKHKASTSVCNIERQPEIAIWPPKPEVVIPPELQQIASKFLRQVGDFRPWRSRIKCRQVIATMTDKRKWQYRRFARQSCNFW